MQEPPSGLIQSEATLFELFPRLINHLMMIDNRCHLVFDAL